MKKFVLLAAVVAAASFSTTANASAGYATESQIEDSIESHGFVWNGHRHASDSAMCLGLKRFGYRSGDFEDYYRVMKCDVTTADESWWTVRIRTTGAHTYTVTSAVKEF